MNAPATPTDSTDTLAKRKRSTRRRWGTMFGIVLLAGIVVGAYLAWYELVGKLYESTDNAYVHGPIVQITPQQAGTVYEISAHDTDFVQAGQILVRLDPSDARVAVEP